MYSKSGSKRRRASYSADHLCCGLSLSTSEKACGRSRQEVGEDERKNHSRFGPEPQIALPVC